MLLSFGTRERFQELNVKSSVEHSKRTGIVVLAGLVDVEGLLGLKVMRSLRVDARSRLEQPGDRQCGLPGHHL